MDFLHGFASGLMVSDGSVSANGREIKFSVTSKELTRRYVNILKRLGVHVSFYECVNKQGFAGPHKIYLAKTKGKGNVTKFYNNIGLKEPNRLRKLESGVLIN